MTPVLSRAQLCARHCQAQEAGQAIGSDQVNAQLAELAQWQVCDGALERSLSFADFHQVMAFVNALAEMVHGEDHHPDLALGYNRCTVRWQTHAVSGISENDFICAAKTDAVHERFAR